MPPQSPRTHTEPRRRTQDSDKGEDTLLGYPLIYVDDDPKMSQDLVFVDPRIVFGAEAPTSEEA